MDKVVEDMGIIIVLSTAPPPPRHIHMRGRRSSNKVANRNYVVFSGTCGITEQINSPFYDY